MQRRTLIATVTTAGLLALTGGAAFAQAGGGSSSDDQPGTSSDVTIPSASAPDSTTGTTTGTTRGRHRGADGHRSRLDHGQLHRSHRDGARCLGARLHRPGWHGP